MVWSTLGDDFLLQFFWVFYSQIGPYIFIKPQKGAYTLWIYENLSWPNNQTVRFDFFFLLIYPWENQMTLLRCRFLQMLSLGFKTSSIGIDHISHILDIIHHQVLS